MLLVSSVMSTQGPSAVETPAAEPIQAGEEIIDIGEYYGSENLADAGLVRYLQLKHSTQNADAAWTASGLAKTIQGFVSRYLALERQLGADALPDRFEFVFVTNRPIASNIIRAVSELAAGRPAPTKDDQKIIENPPFFLSQFRAGQSPHDAGSDLDQAQLHHLPRGQAD